ncbi:Alpha/beta hydrolase family protein [Microlunatus sagamiharensis]|uniref:Alpha/beta hydrolase family protein n=1 Tax=Microlunatus sagamiharensis TaxID=546874 RepID=A0A1H2NEG0_9ACTN|nr:prolyl oligopeptidase family serine peptidase [Microlunatus sagamiharensis]SDV03196.1 Alpha/beta hydrolase family protein [Microlunatus sagamiharensis]
MTRLPLASTVLPAALGLLGLLAGCSAQPDPERSSSPSASAPSSAAATAGPDPTPSASPSPSPSPTPSATPEAEPTPKPDPVSMAALIDLRYDGRDLDRGRLLADPGPYKRYAVSFRGDGKKITGIMNLPDGEGPFPVVVLNHGYIDPDTYWSGQGMPREQDVLARRGFAVLHVDYRNHAGSSDDDGGEAGTDYRLRLPYVVDTINAVKAVKGATGSRWTSLDRGSVGWFGRSMGGGVTLRALAVQPGLVDAAAVWASVSSSEADNWERWYEDDPERRATNRRIDRSYGLPDDSPAFWRRASARPSFDRITEPVLVQHGGSDRTCPVRWARTTVDALEDAGVEVRSTIYPGADHTFEGRTFTTAMDRTADFFDDHLR